MTELVRTLIPCVAPRDRAHVIDLDPDDATQHGDKAADAASARPVPAADISVNDGEQSEAKRHEPEWERERSTLARVIDLPPSSIQTTTAEVDVIVPPTPTKTLLPISETEGMTSGAVQPPGSTGTNARFTTSEGTISHAIDTLRTVSDSEGSFTDEGGHGKSEAEPVEPMSEDDEDTLILNGGAGIPTGPVSFIVSMIVSIEHS